MIALEIVFPRLIQTVFAHARMGSQDFVPEERPEFRIAPARIRHDPIEVIEHPSDQMIGIALLGRQRIIDRQTIFSDQMRHDRIAVADSLSAIDDVGQLAARRRLRIENMLMAKGQVA